VRQGNYAGMPARHTFNVVIVGAGHGVGGDATAAPDKVIEYSGAEERASF
jgi:hypothetical protein